MRKTKTPTVSLVDEHSNKLFVITDPIAGNISGKKIVGTRGDLMYLSEDAAKIFKDRILEVHDGIRR